jgi:hypothetical protein
MTTLFYSWQSDTPRKTSHDFIRSVLDDVAEQLATDTSISEAHREIEIDSDTQGIAGQPPIVDTILQKIDSADVFVADVTFTGKREDGRPTPNPNVLIEYGWALRALTHARVICVMNEYYGEPSSVTLPFDMAHLRWPLRYNLAPTASKKELESERKRLTQGLAKAIKLSIPSLETSVEKEFVEHSTGSDEARFRPSSEAIGINDDTGWSEEDKDIILPDGPAAWLRIFPTHNPGKLWEAHELKPAALTSEFLLRPLGQGSSWGYIRAEDGFGIYRDTARNAEGEQLVSPGITFAFGSGEVWSIETAWIKKDGALPFAEKQYAQALDSYAKYLQLLGINGPFKWVAGMQGIKGLPFNYPVQSGYVRLKDRGPKCLADTIVIRGTYDPAKESAQAALLPFFGKLFAKCGLERPKYLPQE